MRRVLILFLALTVSGATTSRAADRNHAGITVERPWARASIGTSRPAAAYLTLVNTGDDVVRLVGVESPVSGRAEMHRTTSEGGIMRMTPVGAVPVAPGKRVVFTPGGLHIMLMDLERPLAKGGTFRLTLRFSDGRTAEVAVPILGPGARGPDE